MYWRQQCSVRKIETQLNIVSESLFQSTISMFVIRNLPYYNLPCSFFELLGMVLIFLIPLNRNASNIGNRNNGIKNRKGIIILSWCSQKFIHHICLWYKRKCLKGISIEPRQIDTWKDNKVKYFMARWKVAPARH